MALPLAAIVAAIGATAIGGGIAIDNITTKNAEKKFNKSEQQLKSALKSQQLQTYLQDSYALGYINRNTYGQALSTYNKLQNGQDVSRKDYKSLTKLYNELYANDSTFRENWNNTYRNLSNEEKLKWLDGASSSGGTIPSPAYLDTSFDTYQREVAPVKLYSNKELAELYDLDFNFENILSDYKAAGEAKVKYADYVSDVAKNMGERANAQKTTDYLTAIRNTKGEAINKGMTTGARAAAEVIATKEAMQNKALEELATSQTRTEATASALLENAQASLNATQVYNNLAKTLGGTSSTLYANDSARYGADILANANFYAADESLRAQRMAANQIMGAMANNARAQYNANYGGLNDVDWLFKNVYMPANNNNVDNAVQELLNSTYTQNTGYDTRMSKWGIAYDKLN